MGIEGGSNSEVQNQEINQANNEQNEINQAEHQRSGEELEGNSTIDNEGERKQIEGKDDATESAEAESLRLDKEDNIEDAPNTEQASESDNVNPEQQLDNQNTIGLDVFGDSEIGEDNNEFVDLLDYDDKIEDFDNLDDNQDSTEGDIQDSLDTEDSIDSDDADDLVEEDNNEQDPLDSEDSIEDDGEESETPEGEEETETSEDDEESETPEGEEETETPEDNEESESLEHGDAFESGLEEAGEVTDDSENHPEDLQENAENISNHVGSDADQSTEVNDGTNSNGEDTSDGDIPKQENDEKTAMFENVSYHQGQNDFGARGTCGPTSIANSLNRVTGTSNYTENAVLHNAMDNDLCSKSWNPNAMGGTTTDNVVSIIDNVKGPDCNIHTEVYEYDKALSVDELADKVDNPGTVAMVGVDSATLWDQRGDVVSSGLFQHTEAPSDHWITVDSPIRDSDGNVIGFNIIDSGGGVDCVDRDKFEAMYQGDANHTVSDPTAIIISNQGEATNTCKTTDGVERTSNYKGSAVESDCGNSTHGEMTEKYAGYKDFSAKQTEIGQDSSLSNQEKVDAIKTAYDNTADKTDINIPADEKYIKGFDDSGRVEYDWPPKLGFKEESIQPITKDAPLPETWDRYGYMGGTNFASVPDAGPYTYSERAIPYVENPDAYHKGTFNNESYFDKVDAVRNGDMERLNSILVSEGVEPVDEKYFEGLEEQYGDYLDDVADSIGEEIDAPYGLQGEAAGWKDMSGGASQYVAPFNGNVLKRLGICQEDA